MGDESLTAWTRILVLGVRLQCNLKFRAMDLVNYLRKMLTNALRALVNNPFKETFLWEMKKSN